MVEESGDGEEYDELEVPSSGWHLIRYGRSPTEVILEPENSRATLVSIAGLVLLVYGVGLFLRPFPTLPDAVGIGLVLVGIFLLLVRSMLTDTLVWDLRKKESYRLLTFAGSRRPVRTYEGDEVFMVVIEVTAAGGYGLSLMTRFGNRYQVVAPRESRRAVKADAQRLARYFNVPVKEGTPDVVPTARAAKTPILKWKKRPRTGLRTAFLVMLLGLPIIVHVVGPMLEEFRG